MKKSDKNLNIVIREYRHEDHNGLVECINDFYKGGYPYPKYLDSGNLDELIETEKMIVTVAENSDGEIVGTSAAQKLDGTFAGSVLLLLRCIKSTYRRMGIGTRQEQFLFDLIEKKFTGMQSLFADVMTHDGVSQMTLCKRGFAFCGFRMMLYKNEIICPNMNYASGTKMTQAIYCRALMHKSVRLFVPSELQPFVTSLYAELGLGCEFAASNGDGGGNTEYTVKINELHKVTEIHISHSVSGDTASLEKTVYDALTGGHTCTVYINMNQSGCIGIYELLKLTGFRFSGIKPMSDTGEYLVMSHIKNCVPNFDDIKYPVEIREYANYIIGGFENDA